MRWISHLIGELNNKYAVFGRHANQHDQANLAIEIERISSKIKILKDRLPLPEGPSA